MGTTVTYDYSSLASKNQFKTIEAELLQKFSQLNTCCLLLIDAALLRRQNNEISLITALEKRDKTKIQTSPNYLTEDFSPWLVSLDLSVNEDIEIFELSIIQALEEIKPESIKRGKGRLVCGWLASHATTQITAFHLGKSATQINNDKNILLRYYDPAVATLLWSMLDNWQQQRILGPVTHWYSLDGDGQLYKRTGQEQQIVRLSYSISLNPENWRNIELITIINFILCNYRQTNQNTQRLKETYIFQIILPALRRATALSFNDREDLVAFGTHALNVSPEFDRHPLISRLLEIELSKQKPCYRQAVAALSETDWDQIRTRGAVNPLA